MRKLNPALVTFQRARLREARADQKSRSGGWLKMSKAVKEILNRGD